MLFVRAQGLRRDALRGSGAQRRLRMKTFKPYAKKSWGVFYRVRDVAGINKKLIESLEWPENICLGISFNPVKLTEFLDRKVRFPSYNATLCCYTSGPGVRKVYPPVPSCGIEVRPPLSFSELKHLQNQMALESAKKRSS